MTDNSHTIDCSNSNALTSASYDSASEHLTVSFEGGTYRYSGVTHDDYQAFASSESKGQAIETIKVIAEGVEKV